MRRPIVPTAAVAAAAVSPAASAGGGSAEDRPRGSHGAAVFP